jgi:hypothetical protein
VSLNDSTVDQRVFEIRLAADLSEKAFKNTTLRPSSEATEHAVPIAEFRRQIPPGQTGAHAPENRL